MRLIGAVFTIILPHMANYDLFEFMTIARALADESRVRTLLALEEGELCVCQIIELLDLAPSTVSKHMALLKQARLVRSRKDGRWIYYRLAVEAPSPVSKAIEWICGSLKQAPEILRDRSHLEQIVCVEPEELCQLQKTRSA